MSNKLTVDFLSESNDPLAQLTIFGDDKISELKENGRYEYELNSTEYFLKKISGVITPSRIKDGNARGLIEPGSYVGLLKLVLLDKDNKTVSRAHIEICSAKLNYQTEYRYMLEDIADRCADFLLQLESPVDQSLIADDQATDATLAQRLYFLKSLLGSDDFQQAIQRIVTMPNTRWREEFRTMDVRQSRRLGRYEVRQFASASRRIKVPDVHPLHSSRITTLPEKIEVRNKRDTVDTPENRFVKYALNMFLQTLEDILALFSGTGNEKYPELSGEIGTLILDLEETLAHDIFKQVSQPDLLPLNSPVLQRKEGYRQVLRAWMLLELAAKLSWTGGDDVYEGGKRDAAALYEYWVFFKLLDIVAEKFDLNSPPVEDLINDKDLVLKLKAGKHLAIDGVYKGAGRHLRIEFSYNRTFSSVDAYPAGGSWTRQMRPDYTLSLWPKEFSQDEAEKQELITHIHFDAKYKVDSLINLFGKDDENLDAEKEEQRTGNYKRADLLKMHAYRDAIRRSAGAYVIYPGTEESNFKGFHELLPGLGAFPLRPSDSDDGSSAIKKFFTEIVEHVCNRATQHEQQTYHTYTIHKNIPPDAVRDTLPESTDESRVKPVTEDYVIHGWIKSNEQLEWVKREGLYNFRTDKDRGSLRLHASVAGASYIILHDKNQYRGGGELFRVATEGPRVFSQETLQAKGYPGGGSRPYYLVFDVKPLGKDDLLSKYDWDLSLIDGIGSRRQSAIPNKGIKLSDLMKGAQLKSDGLL